MARHLMAAAVLLMAAGIAGAQAEDYPARTVTIIVPFAAGGPADITGRIVADIFNHHLGQTFVVENAGGAGGTVGTLRAARAAADGYTILSGHLGTNALAPAFYPDLGYDPQRVAAEEQNGVGTPYIPPMTRRLKCRIDPEQSPYTCMLPEHKPVRRGREMIDLLAVEEPKPKPAKNGRCRTRQRSTSCSNAYGRLVRPNPTSGQYSQTAGTQRKTSPATATWQTD